VEASLFLATSILIYRTTRHGILKDIYPLGHRHDYHKYQNPALYTFVESIWNVMAHGDAWEGKWRGNWRMEWVASTLHTTSEHGVSSITTITTANAHTSAASSRLNWRPRRFKWTRPFRRKTKSGFYACAITFHMQSTAIRLEKICKYKQRTVTMTAGNRSNLQCSWTAG
jgi:hypothetical protein